MNIWLTFCTTRADTFYGEQSNIVSSAHFAIKFFLKYCITRVIVLEYIFDSTLTLMI